MRDMKEQRVRAGAGAPQGVSGVDGGGLNRRNLLRSSAAGGLIGAASPSAAPGQQSQTAGAAGRLTVKDVLERARERLHPTCRVCQVCDGVACSGDDGGIKGAGTGMSFQNNFTALQRVKFVMRNIHEIRMQDVDTSTTIFGRKISFPAVCAPMGPAGTKFGKGMPQEEWFESLIGGCNAAGTLGAVGDDPRYPEADVRRNLVAIKRHNGLALYNSKPAPNPIILKWQALIEECNPAWISLDVDDSPKSVAELKELTRAFKIPIVLKGIMRVDDGLRAIDAGAAGIAVSNHGGRRLDHTAGTAEVLPAIAAKLKGKIPILCDGCVASGADVLKYLGLGADVVMVGRHVLRAAYGGGVEGVALFMNRVRDELQRAMVQTGVAKIADINGGILYA
jgi:hypothetical protein